jgi:hypothetical protein
MHEIRRRRGKEQRGEEIACDVNARNGERGAWPREHALGVDSLAHLTSCMLTLLPLPPRAHGALLAGLKPLSCKLVSSLEFPTVVARS